MQLVLFIQFKVSTFRLRTGAVADDKKRRSPIGERRSRNVGERLFRKFVLVFQRTRSIVNLHVDVAGVRLYVHTGQIGIAQHGEIAAVLALVPEFVTVDMGRQHQVDARTVENRDEQPRHLRAAVPAAGSRRHVAEDDAHGGALEIGLLDHARQPLGLLGTEIVGTHQIHVADVAVGLVFAAVEHDEVDGPLTERKVRTPRRRRKVVHPLHGERTAVLMVAARHVERRIGGEELRRRGEVVIHQLALGVDRRGHVAVEADEVVLAGLHVLVENAQDRVVLVHVVHHREGDLALRAVERRHLEGLVPQDVAAEALAEDDALAAFVHQHAVLHHPVTVGGGGFESAHRHHMELSDRTAAVEHLIVFRTFGVVEMRTVVGCDLDPRDGVDVGGPNHRELPLAHRLEVGAGDDMHRRLRGGRHRQREQEGCQKKVEKSFHFREYV